jgi:hypothetical protein
MCKNIEEASLVAVWSRIVCDLQLFQAFLTWPNLTPFEQVPHLSASTHQDPSNGAQFVVIGFT